MNEPIHPVQTEALKRMTPAQKLQAVQDMWELARECRAAGIRMRHPEWDEVSVENEVRRQLLYACT